VATRAYVLGQLQRELRHAQDCHAGAYAAQLEQEIARLSAGTPADPARETLAAGESGEVTHGAVRPRRPRAAR
jgi:hypothetical protein